MSIHLRIKCAGLDRFGDACEVGVQERGRAFVSEKARQTFPRLSIEIRAMFQSVELLLAPSTSTARANLDDLDEVPLGELAKAATNMPLVAPDIIHELGRAHGSHPQLHQDARSPF